MIVKKKEKSKIEIDIDGPEGNAFHLLGVAKNLCKKLNMDFETFHREACSDDYTNLIKTFDKYFGTIVTIATSNADLLK